MVDKYTEEYYYFFESILVLLHDAKGIGDEYERSIERLQVEERSPCVQRVYIYGVFCIPVIIEATANHEDLLYMCSEWECSTSCTHFMKISDLKRRNSLRKGNEIPQRERRPCRNERRNQIYLPKISLT